MTTVPQDDSNYDYDNDDDYPEDMRITVAARDFGKDDGKEVKITLGDDEVIFSPSHSNPEVKVNGKQVQVSEDKSYVETDDDDEDEIQFEIYQLPDGSVKLSSDEYGIEAVYDGSRVKISVSLMPYILL